MTTNEEKRGQRFSRVKQQFSLQFFETKRWGQSGGWSEMKRGSHEGLLNKNIESTDRSDSQVTA